MISSETATLCADLEAIKRLADPKLSPFHDLALTNMRAIVRRVDAIIARTPADGPEPVGFDAVDAACRANIHPDSDPSDVERRKMRRALEAALPYITHPVPADGPADAVSEAEVEAAAQVIADSPLIDAPKLPAPCWRGLARAVIEAAQRARK